MELIKIGQIRHKEILQGKTKKKSTLKTSLIANISAKTFFLRKKLELSRCVVG